MSEIDLSKIKKTQVPDSIHFVWIGDLNEVNTSYIDVWKRTNKDKEIFFGTPKMRHYVIFFTTPYGILSNSKKEKIK
nr:TcdA/TcdB catalytic glycosyltransferase domain-containing protein [Serratia sp. PAMC26656]